MECLLSNDEAGKMFPILQPRIPDPQIRYRGQRVDRSDQSRSLLLNQHLVRDGAIVHTSQLSFHLLQSSIIPSQERSRFTPGLNSEHQ